MSFYPLVAVRFVKRIPQEKPKDGQATLWWFGLVACGFESLVLVDGTNPNHQREAESNLLSCLRTHCTPSNLSGEVSIGRRSSDLKLVSAEDSRDLFGFSRAMLIQT